MIKSNLILGCLLLSLTLSAQKNLYIGVEAGPTNDRFEYFDDGDLLVTTALPNARAGMIIGYTFKNSLSIETGFIKKNYKEGFGFELETFESSTQSTSIRTWQFPLRIKPRIKMFGEKVFFVPTIGFNYCINLDDRFHSGGGGSGGTPEEQLSYDYNVEYGLTRSFPLLETGLGIEFLLFKKVIASFTASYFTGFKPVIELDMVYRLNDEPETMVRAHSKGEYVTFYLGLSYPITGKF